MFLAVFFFFFFFLYIVYNNMSYWEWRDSVSKLYFQLKWIFGERLNVKLEMVMVLLEQLRSDFMVPFSYLFCV